jgi:hypothetical protein
MTDFTCPVCEYVQENYPSVEGSINVLISSNEGRLRIDDSSDTDIRSDAEISCENCDYMGAIYKFLPANTNVYSAWKQTYLNAQLEKINTVVHSEGWYLYSYDEDDGNGVRVLLRLAHTDTGDSPFDNVDVAVSHVVALASLGSGLHIAACKFMGIETPVRAPERMGCAACDDITESTSRPSGGQNT